MSSPWQLIRLYVNVSGENALWRIGLTAAKGESLVENVCDVLASGGRLVVLVCCLVLVTRGSAFDGVRVGRVAPAFQRPAIR